MRSITETTKRTQVSTDILSHCIKSSRLSIAMSSVIRYASSCHGINGSQFIYMTLFWRLIKVEMKKARYKLKYSRWFMRRFIFEPNWIAFNRVARRQFQKYETAKEKTSFQRGNTARNQKKNSSNMMCKFSFSRHSDWRKLRAWFAPDDVMLFASSHPIKFTTVKN